MRKTPKKYNTSGPTKSVRAFSLDNALLDWVDCCAENKGVGRSQLVNEILTNTRNKTQPEGRLP